MNHLRYDIKPFNVASVILPDQLFEEKPDEDEVYVVEHPHYFTRLDFHKQKLVLHRASMKRYAEQEEAEYIEFEEALDRLEALFADSEQIKLYDPVNHEIRAQLQELAHENGAKIEFLETPGFIASREFNREYFSEHEYFQLAYYKEMRKRENVLVDEEGKPEGGKWSFDPENRKKMPEDEEIPEIPSFSNEYVEEAKKYVEENFSDNPGEIENFRWPTTREEARENLQDFLENRLENFGDYQDALDRDLRYGYHSLLSSSINTGLLTPNEVVQRTLEAHEGHDYPMNSLEGFLRQIIGWREFIRALYELEPDMDENNFWNAENELPEEFYTAETSLPPVDVSIENAQKDAYCHHIERLMILGNVMLLLEIDPDEVYRWFSEMFIDAYDWVMKPNVYGMSQYAYTDMMTKPYISSSNYIGKMSHYESGDWEEGWDGLYWSFLKKHREKVEGIQRMSFMTSHLDRMDEEDIAEHIGNSDRLRERLGL